MMLFEIRNYYRDPAYQEAYTEWVTREALPYLAQRLDLVGFWVTTNDPPEIGGAPMDKLGAANVTWIIRWRDLVQRNDVLPGVLSGAVWDDIFSRVPGGRAAYLRTEVKFAESLLAPRDVLAGAGHPEDL
jgi:hypothetical protein